MNLRQLEVLEAVLRTGSLREAGRMLGISQPAVSKSLRLAEQSAGFVLFRRIRGRLWPSTEAETLLPDIARLRNDLAAIETSLRRLRDGGVGRLAIAASGSLAHDFVTPAVARFAGERPGIRFELLVLPAAIVAERVVHGGVDIGVVNQPIDSPYLGGQAVCEGDGICVLPSAHPLASRSAIGVADLASDRLIGYGEDTANGPSVRRAFMDAGDRRSIDFTVNQSRQALDLVQSGLGVAIMDPFPIVVAPRRGLVAVPFRPAFANRVRIIRARERPRSRMATQFERVLRETILQRIADSPLASLVRPVRR